MRGVEQHPTLYDAFVQPLNRLMLDRWRQAQFGDLAGDVLELGAGTGLNFHAYGPDARITALEIDAALRHAARPRAAERHMKLIQGDAQALPFADHSFDYVTSALVFCTIPDPDQALHEVARVLRPHGMLVQLEHTRTNHPLPDAALAAIAPAWKLLAGGCDLNRDTPARLLAAGWQLVVHRRHAGGLLRLIRARPPQTIQQSSI